MTTSTASRHPINAGIASRLDRSVEGILAAGGLEALEALPDIGPRLARAIRDVLTSGRLPMLERLRGESDPVALLRTVTGIGATLAEHLSHELGIESLEGLEAAAHDGRGERQYTVVTAHRGPLEGRRVVRGRESECDRFYREEHDHASEAAPLAQATSGR